MSQEINLLLELDEYQEWIFSVVPSHDMKSRIKEMGHDSFKKIKAKFSENAEESCEKCSERLKINLFYFDDLENQQFDQQANDIEEPQPWEPECIIQRQDSYEVNEIKEEPPVDMEEVDFIGFDEPDDYEITETKNLSEMLDEETIRNMPILKSEDKNDHKPFKCPKCDMGFVAQKNVRRHLKNNSCKFPRPSLPPPVVPKITLHIEKIQSEDVDMFDDTMDEDSLRALTIPKSTEEDDKKPYKCPKCKLGFVAQKNVRRHLKNNSCKSDDIQQGLRPYMCPNCKMRFTTRNNTKKHIARNACGALDSSNGTEPLMVDETNPKPFKCPECGIGFSCRKNVLRHLNANACQMLKGSGNKRAVENCHTYLPKDLVLPDLSQIKPPFLEAFEQADGTFAYVSLSSKQAELRVTNFDPNHLTCELCQETMKNTSDLISHRKHVHFFPKNQMECAGCGKSFENSNEKRLHSFYCVDKFNIVADQEMT